MIRSLLVLFLLIKPQGICALNSKMDLRLESFARPFPLGGFLKVDIGLAKKVWESKESNSPFYGMIRPSVEFQTSGVLNSARTFFELYPISFLSLYLGKAYIYRNSKTLDTFDCSQTNCNTGFYKRNLWGAKMAIKVGSFFYLTRLQWQTSILEENPFTSFAEEQGTLIAMGIRDTLFYQTHILGYEINKIQSIALLYKRNRIKSTHASTSMGMLLYRHQFIDPVNPKKGRNLALSLGPGFYRTRQSKTHLSFIASVLYNWDNGLRLF